MRRVGLVEMFLWNIIIIKLLVFFLSLLLAYYTTYYNYINYYTIINNYIFFKHTNVGKMQYFRLFYLDLTDNKSPLI